MAIITVGGQGFTIPETEINKMKFEVFAEVSNARTLIGELDPIDFELTVNSLGASMGGRLMKHRIAHTTPEAVKDWLPYSKIVIASVVKKNSETQPLWVGVFENIKRDTDSDEEYLDFIPPSELTIDDWANARPYPNVQLLTSGVKLYGYPSQTVTVTKSTKLRDVYQEKWNDAVNASWGIHGVDLKFVEGKPSSASYATINAQNLVPPRDRGFDIYKPVTKWRGIAGDDWQSRSGSRFTGNWQPITTKTVPIELKPNTRINTPKDSGNTSNWGTTITKTTVDTGIYAKYTFPIRSYLLSAAGVKGVDNPNATYQPESLAFEWSVKFPNTRSPQEYGVMMSFIVALTNHAYTDVAVNKINIYPNKNFDGELDPSSTDPPYRQDDLYYMMGYEPNSSAFDPIGYGNYLHEPKIQVDGGSKESGLRVFRHEIRKDLLTDLSKLNGRSYIKIYIYIESDTWAYDMSNPTSHLYATFKANTILTEKILPTSVEKPKEAYKPFFGSKSWEITYGGVLMPAVKITNLPDGVDEFVTGARIIGTGGSSSQAAQIRTEIATTSTPF